MHATAQAGAALALSVICAAQSPIRLEVFGTSPHANLGMYGVLGIGDVNGDAIEDFIASSSLQRSVYAYSGASGQVLWAVVDPEVGSQFGKGINSGGDVDGDGVRDVVVGAFAHKDVQGNIVGATYLLSGASGNLVRMHEGASGSPLPGFAGPIVGDSDADGYDDYLLFSSANPLSGAVTLRSGVNGVVLHSWSSVLNASAWGCPIGDIDGDGRDDVLLSEAGCGASVGACRGAVACYSGLTGALLYRVYGDSVSVEDVIGMTGVSCAGEDLSGDGVPDFVVSADTLPTTNGQDRGMVRAYSGANGTVLWTRYGNPQDRLGAGLSIGDDWNRDGHADVLALEFLPTNDISILSGADGSLLGTLSSPSPYQGWGSLSISIAGDVDGDGMREIVTAGNTVLLPIAFPGIVYVLSFAAGPSAYRLHHGRPCPGSNGHLPRVRIPVDPRLGSVADVRLRGALPLTWSLLAVGLPTSLDLTGIGATNCTLMVDPVWLSGPVILDADGMGRHPVPIPPDSGLQGLVLQAQWVVGDATANGLGLTFSDAARVMVGW